ncbi:N-acetylglucosamine-6-phosphate deacetylase [Nocardia pseudobrasiliensis]|uniref:N-acetylglucosamine 6-phosphate deacetylase n=1 Tax=Nocardia pseudobrasiliensis TaxID=45979 RepID=A0A370I834_9NOCA|nr:amidohydrolase family protein [Nocardia pseudobrasiliensis]RDI66291.1 N-acetylglucosamine 6-phosphate deacetylase [Nocardia pseudobrasiliensis]
MSDLRLRGRILTGVELIEDGVLTVRGDRVIAVESLTDWIAGHPDSELPAHLGPILPGLVDIHNHGGFGHRFDTTDPDEARAAAAFHHAQGSTSVIASIVTAAPADMVAQARALQVVADEGMLAGIHAEGPFLSANRCGAQDPRYLIDPDLGLVERLLAVSGSLRMMTLAPERPGFEAAAKLLAEHGIVVALGHSDAPYAEFRAALAPAGFATVVTHLANGMPPLHHRGPGPVAAGLVAAAEERAYVELIGDGVHVEPGFGALVFATARHRVALVTDAMQAAGLPDGEYRLGPQRVRVVDGVARVASGSIAGGTATLLRCVRWMVRECGVPLIDAVRAATVTPAAALGLTDVGELRPGAFADVVVVDPELGLRRVLRQGQWLT